MNSVLEVCSWTWNALVFQVQYCHWDVCHSNSWCFEYNHFPFSDFLVFVMSFPSVMKSHSVHLAVSFFFFPSIYLAFSGPSQSENHVLRFWTVLWNIKKSDFCPLLEHILSWNGALIHWISNFLNFFLCFLLFKKSSTSGIFPHFTFQPMYWIPMSVIKFLISKSSLKISNFLFITSCSHFIDEKLFNPQLSSRITVAVSLKCPSVPCAVCFPLISS